MGLKVLSGPPNKRLYKKWASGTQNTDGSGNLVVTGLGFVPTYVIYYQTVDHGTYHGFAGMLVRNATDMQYAAATNTRNGINFFRQNVTDAGNFYFIASTTWTSTGFTVQAVNGLTTKWWAFE